MSQNNEKTRTQTETIYEEHVNRNHQSGTSLYRGDMVVMGGRCRAFVPDWEARKARLEEWGERI